ncbi:MULTISPECIES: SAM-dependent methyltransferase [unclassified Sphingomonas]|uniref:SAM-dependent methyltransferase n=1 Tax=unclassified Sphingomonas TaxID=196159 RepID=UPI0006FEDDAC|nr:MULTISPECIES: cyclopropane-fatty-acyl-phospholipid synthase family protein [unclassified Sphingomonas]KQX25483.1 cyclopropane-fatty-acyl-phospholipid synthase [Sphingomonas sp. Root1294]KQY66475.1 cyclopropane-fatty-acyl-phospholipid synthase [Sphingomonas sp. Root50]KRB90207.1 cyclopropane-fatty-acyl-phospholipid synthase [Sphingomonas sp. Root720]
MSLFDRFAGHLFKRGEMTIIMADGSVRRYGTPDPAIKPVTIRFVDKGVTAFIARNPHLHAAEAFMEGRLTIEQGDIRDLVDLVRSNGKWEEGRVTLRGTLRSLVRDRLRAQIQSINWASRSKANVAHHYDLSDRLYDLFLDADRQYSCAYFTDPDNDLEQAQADKKAHIAAKLHLKPGQRVLDIGCGWGGMALYLNRVAGVDVLGITLSEEQLKVARARAEAAGVSDRVKFELVDYRALEGRFDRIVSVGMFEHVGVPQYETFFMKCRELLADDGVMLLHTIGRLGGPGKTDAFTLKYIFPGGYNPALSEIVAASEPARMIVADVETLRLHYGMTLDRWYDRTVAAKEAIVDLYDERFFRMWTFYLAGARAAFYHGNLCNYQVQYVRDRRALPITRSYMAEKEAALPR